MIRRRSVLMLLCLRCGHEWIPRKAKDPSRRLPKECPLCHSAYWDRPRIEAAIRKLAVPFVDLQIERLKTLYPAPAPKRSISADLEADLKARLAREPEPEPKP
jgi:hypothetical protein